jgi:hypothetical protein
VQEVFSSVLHCGDVRAITPFVASKHYSTDSASLSSTQVPALMSSLSCTALELITAVGNADTVTAARQATL